MSVSSNVRCGVVMQASYPFGVVHVMGIGMECDKKHAIEGTKRSFIPLKPLIGIVRCCSCNQPACLPLVMVMRSRGSGTCDTQFRRP